MPAGIDLVPKQIPIGPSPEIKLQRGIKARLNQCLLRFYAYRSIGLQGIERVKSNDTLIIWLEKNGTPMEVKNIE
jgi:hypothetical protein